MTRKEKQTAEAKQIAANFIAATRTYSVPVAWRMVTEGKSPAACQMARAKFDRDTQHRMVSP
jgi:hypothetical protein